jgi:hypothetical protein
MSVGKLLTLTKGRIDDAKVGKVAGRAHGSRGGADGLYIVVIACGEAALLGEAIGAGTGRTLVILGRGLEGGGKVDEVNSRGGLAVDFQDIALVGSCTGRRHVSEEGSGKAPGTKWGEGEEGLTDKVADGVVGSSTT